MYTIIIICSLILIYFIFKFYNKNKIIVISVDGNIGSGKSTLVKYLKSKYKNLYFLDEPVDEWVRIIDDNDENILHKFYNDKSRYSYLFQNFAFITRANILLNNINNLKNLLGKKIIITERSVETDASQRKAAEIIEFDDK